MKFIRVLKASKYFFECSRKSAKFPNLYPDTTFCAVLRVGKREFKDLIESGSVIYQGNLEGQRAQILSAGEIRDGKKSKFALYNDQTLSDIGYMTDITTTAEFDPTANKYFVFK